MIIVMSYFLFEVLCSVGIQTEKTIGVKFVIYMCDHIFGTVAVIELNVVVQ